MYMVNVVYNTLTPLFDYDIICPLNYDQMVALPLVRSGLSVRTRSDREGYQTSHNGTVDWETLVDCHSL